MKNRPSENRRHRRRPLMRLLPFLLSPALDAGELPSHTPVPPAFRDEGNPDPRGGLTESIRGRGPWSFAFSVGIIGDTTPGDWLSGDFDRYEGPGEGHTYNLTASYQLHELDWTIGGLHLRPTVELPLMLTIVDQDVGGTFPDLNAGMVVRWRDFPWNDHVCTTFAVGGGLSWALEDWTADVERHDGENRSNLKFWLSLELTAALPSRPDHQLFLFIDHQSGGHVFDDGGVDAWGIGFRRVF